MRIRTLNMEAFLSGRLVRGAYAQLKTAHGLVHASNDLRFGRATGPIVNTRLRRPLQGSDEAPYPSGPSAMKQIGSIQILRAVAALMVVLTHAQDDALNE